MRDWRKSSKVMSILPDAVAGCHDTLHALHDSGERRFRWGFGFGCWVIKKRYVWILGGNRVRGVVDEPKPFFLMNRRIRIPPPSLPNPPVPKLARFSV